MPSSLHSPGGGGRGWGRAELGGSVGKLSSDNSGRRPLCSLRSCLSHAVGSQELGSWGLGLTGVGTAVQSGRARCGPGFPVVGVLEGVDWELPVAPEERWPQRTAQPPLALSEPVGQHSPGEVASPAASSLRLRAAAGPTELKIAA